ncbi:MAG: pilus assembly protein PilP [Oceanospirillaceae bacterium]|nr:pilus assembly protein PilP [Oceanospirillaceae bacterium]
MMIQNKQIAAALALALGLQGCIWVEDTTDLRQFVADKSAQPGGRIEPLPEFKPYESFVYEGSSLRDPFVPLVMLSEETSVPMDGQTELQPDDERIKEYLEEFPVDQLAMVGTITALENGELISLVRDTNGEVHQVVVGNHMGLDFGEVIAIDERSMKLEEIVSNGRGGWMKRPRTVNLPELE